MKKEKQKTKENCPYCGEDLTKLFSRAAHSCAADIETHPAGCQCVYCEQEEKFAAHPEEPIRSELEEFALQVRSALTEYAAIRAACEAADARDACSPDLSEKECSKGFELSEFLFHREKRKKLIALLDGNKYQRETFILYDNVCRDYLYLENEVRRALRLNNRL